MQRKSRETAISASSSQRTNDCIPPCKNKLSVSASKFWQPTGEPAQNDFRMNISGFRVEGPGSGVLCLLSYPVPSVTGFGPIFTDTSKSIVERLDLCHVFVQVLVCTQTCQNCKVVSSRFRLKTFRSSLCTSKTGPASTFLTRSQPAPISRQTQLMQPAMNSSCFCIHFPSETGHGLCHRLRGRAAIFRILVPSPSIP